MSHQLRVKNSPVMDRGGLSNMSYAQIRTNKMTEIFNQYVKCQKVYGLRKGLQNIN